MTEADAHYVDTPSSGTSFHLTGALLRLGKKVVTLRSSQSASIEKFPIFFADSLEVPSLTENNVKVAFFCLEESLPRNTRPTESQINLILNRAKLLHKNNPQARMIFLLPKNSLSIQIKKIFEEASKAIVLVSPALYGFRDSGLMDELISQSQSRFPNWSTCHTLCDLLYIPDAVGILVSAISIELSPQTLIELPATTLHPQELVATFRKHFHSKQGSARSTIAKLFKDPVDQTIIPSTFDYPSATKALNVFPTSPQSLDRGLKESGRLYKIDPNALMHYPPGKSL